MPDSPVPESCPATASPAPEVPPEAASSDRQPSTSEPVAPAAEHNPWLISPADGTTNAPYFGPPPVNAPDFGSPPRVSGMAIAALVLGICGFLLITIPLAVIFAIIALVQNSKTPYQAAAPTTADPMVSGVAVAKARKSTSILAIVAISASALWTALTTVVLVFVWHPNLSACHPAPGYAAVCDLKPGECFDLPAPPQKVRDFRLIDCGLPHNTQAIGAYLEPPGPWPGSEGYARDLARCRSVVTKNLDRSKIAPTDKLSYLAPDQVSWNAGYHNVICIVKTASQRTGTVLRPGADLSIPTGP